MEEVEPHLIAFNRWLAGTVFVPLLPLIGIFIMRGVNGDHIDSSLLWCSEVPTFALQLAIIIIAKSDEIMRTPSISSESRQTASLYRNASYLLAFVTMFCFYSLCRDGTLTDRISDTARIRTMWLTVIVTALLLIVTLIFSLWQRNLAKGSQR